MCFSATASFAAAGVLGIAGATSLYYAKNTPVKWYAAIPLLFGIQQGIEGVQWLLQGPSLACSTAGYGFLFFAFLLWPVYVPFAMQAMERQQERKKLLVWLTWFGAAITLYFSIWYLTSPLTITLTDNSVVYNMAIPLAANVAPMYVLVTGSGIFSSRVRVQIFSLVVLVGAAVSAILYRYAFTSVWCFFAAVSSLLVLLEAKYVMVKPVPRKRR